MAHHASTFFPVSSDPFDAAQITKKTETGIDNELSALESEINAELLA